MTGTGMTTLLMDEPAANASLRNQGRLYPWPVRHAAI